MKRPQEGPTNLHASRHAGQTLGILANKNHIQTNTGLGVQTALRKETMELSLDGSPCADRRAAQNSILQAGKDSSCITTVLLLAKTMMLSSCCFSCVCWYHSRVTAVSCVGMRVTWGDTMGAVREKGGTFAPGGEAQKNLR